MMNFTSDEYTIIIIALSLMLFLVLMSIVIEIVKKKDKAYFEAINTAQVAYEELLSQSGIRDIDEMDGLEFEHYLVVLFEKMGIPATRTPSSGDFGADLILEGQERVVVQAKRYQDKVGIKAVQEINSARAYYEAHEAWVITNSFFTPQAIKLAQSTGVKLIDRDALVDLILNFNNDRKKA